MSSFDYTEKRFEEDIEEYLITKGGYIKGNPKNFDRKLALDINTFLAFIKKSQPKQWERYEKIYPVTCYHCKVPCIQHRVRL